MNDILCESLLEMHFHSAIVNHFASVFGAKFLKLIKPTTNQEVWVGFDQGWVFTTMTESDVLKELKDAIHDKHPAFNIFYLGYFLQFKRVEQMKRRSVFTPLNWHSPYLRAELSLDINPSRVLNLSLFLS